MQEKGCGPRSIRENTTQILLLRKLNHREGWYPTQPGFNRRPSGRNAKRFNRQAEENVKTSIHHNMIVYQLSIWSPSVSLSLVPPPRFGMKSDWMAPGNGFSHFTLRSVKISIPSWKAGCRVWFWKREALTATMPIEDAGSLVSYLNDRLATRNLTLCVKHCAARSAICSWAASSLTFWDGVKRCQFRFVLHIISLRRDEENALHWLCIK